MRRKCLGLTRVSIWMECSRAACAERSHTTRHWSIRECLPIRTHVAIIGGGEGATLRKILKHKFVESVTMVKINKELVSMCQEHLPEWSDCSNIEGSDADSCFNGSRASPKLPPSLLLLSSSMHLDGLSKALAGRMSRRTNVLSL